MNLPTIIYDTREAKPLSFDNLHIRGIKSLPTERRTLKTGDYTASGLEDILCIERKSVQDLYGTLFTGRERFERELARMQSFKYKYLVIESTPFGFAQHMEWHRHMAQFNSAFSTLMIYAERYSLKVRWAKTRDGSADYIARLAIRIMQDESSLPLSAEYDSASLSDISSSQDHA